MDNKIIKRYKQYQRNLVHNIKYERKIKKEYEDNPYYDEEVKQRVINHHNKMIEYSKGQLSLIHELLFDLQNKRDYYFHTSIDYRLGEI